MSAPETIWARVSGAMTSYPSKVTYAVGGWSEIKERDGYIQYTRTDIHKIALARIAELEAALLMRNIVESCLAEGKTFDEMRENVRKTDLYKRGDCQLRWVSEADIIMHDLALHLEKEAAKAGMKDKQNV